MTDLAGIGSVPGMLLWGLLATAVVSDLHQRRIPNLIPLSLAVAGLTVNLWLRPAGPALVGSGAGLLVGFVLWLPPYTLGFAGAADLKLAAALGVWLGPLSMLRASVLAALVGGALALLWLVRYRGLLGTWVFLQTLSFTPLAGNDVRSGERTVSVSSASIPYALALAIGTGLEVYGPSLAASLS